MPSSIVYAGENRSMSIHNLEPWLRGPKHLPNPVAAHLRRGSDHIREDSAKALAPLTASQIWATPHGVASAGFHAKHLAGSTRRLTAYLAGRQLDEAELAASRGESDGTESAAELIRAIQEAFDDYEALVLALPEALFGEIREIGRKRIPATAVSSAIHIVEHGQRHVGQLISAAKLSTAMNAE